MSYVIFEKSTTKIVRIMRNGYWQDARFKSPGAAKAALTRLAKQPGLRPTYAADHDIAEYQEFLKIEKTEVRNGVGPAHGKQFTVPVNTSWTSGPWSETYWCS